MRSGEDKGWFEDALHTQPQESGLSLSAVRALVGGGVMTKYSGVAERGDWVGLKPRMLSTRRFRKDTLGLRLPSPR